MTRRTWTIVGGVVALVVVVFLVVMQLTLPGIAEDRARDDVGDPAAKVSVKASPTLKLLFGNADEVTVDTPTVGGTADAPLGKLFDRAKDVGRTDARVGRVQVQGLTLRDVHAVVEDGRVRADATLSIRALTQMVPAGGRLRALAPGADGAPRFAVTVDVPLLGETTVNAAVAAVDGAVQVAAEDLPIPLAITVFQDPSIAVDSVQGRARGDELKISFSGTLN